MIASRHGIAIERAQPAALAGYSQDTGQGGMQPSRPIFRVDIDEIDDASHPAARAARQELRHRRRVGENAPDRPTLHQAAHPAGESVIAQHRDAEGLALQQRAAARRHRAFGAGGEVAFRAQARRWSAWRQSSGSSMKHPR